MSGIKGTATSELSMLKDGTIKRVMTFKTLADAGMMETGKEYVIGAQDSQADATTDEPLAIRAERAYRALGEILDDLIDKNERMEAAIAQYQAEEAAKVPAGLFDEGAGE